MMEINTAVRIIRDHIFDYLHEMRGGRNAGRTGLIEAANTIYDYANAKEKYRWHDLRKNPEDLPNNKTDYLVVIQWEDGTITCAVRNKKYLRYVEYSGADKCPYPYKVVAWKDIELFEDVNE